MMRATKYMKNKGGRPKGSRNLLTIEEKRMLLRPIQPGLDYTMIQIAEHTGISLRTLRQLISQGLPARKIGGSCFILGSDWISWTKANLETRGVAPTPAPQAKGKKS